MLFVDALGYIVDEVRKEWDQVELILPQYLYGHYRAIAEELIKQSTDPNKRDIKYPLIILGIDNEYSETEINDFQYSVNANIWIVGETKKEWFTSERYDYVFKTVLYPIYEILKKKIFDATFVSSILSDIAPVVRPVPYWGVETAQGSETQYVADPLDALTFKLDGLIINKNC